MTELVFVDTNVLVYRFDAGKPKRQKAADAWVARLWEIRSGRLSFQVLREFYVTSSSRKLPNRLETGAARSHRSCIAGVEAGRLQRPNHAPPRGKSKIDTRSRGGTQLIVAAAREQACTILLTEDLQDGQVLAGVRVVSPFRTRRDARPTPSGIWSRTGASFLFAVQARDYRVIRHNTSPCCHPPAGVLRIQMVLLTGPLEVP